MRGPIDRRRRSTVKEVSTPGPAAAPPSDAAGSSAGADCGGNDRNGPLLPLLSSDCPSSSCHQELHQMRDRLQALFEGVETGIIVIDPATHRIVDANPVALSLVGAPQEKIVGAVCHRFVCPAETGRCPVTDLGQPDLSERGWPRDDILHFPAGRELLRRSDRGQRYSFSAAFFKTGLCLNRVAPHLPSQPTA